MMMSSWPVTGGGGVGGVVPPFPPLIANNSAFVKGWVPALGTTFRLSFDISCRDGQSPPPLPAAAGTTV